MPWPQVPAIVRSGRGPSYMVVSLPWVASPPLSMKPSVRPRRYAVTNGYGSDLESMFFWVFAPPP